MAVPLAALESKVDSRGAAGECLTNYTGDLFERPGSHSLMLIPLRRVMLGNEIPLPSISY